MLVLSCSDSEDSGDDTAAVSPTLEDIFSKVFVPQCAQSACHGASAGAGGLILASSRAAEPSEEELGTACLNLVDQPVQNPNVTGGTRLIRGDAQNSFLVQVLEGDISIVAPPQCQRSEDCNCPMPLTADCTTSMPADRVSAVRQWIDGMSESDCRSSTERGPDAGADGASDVATDAPFD